MLTTLHKRKGEWTKHKALQNLLLLFMVITGFSAQFFSTALLSDFQKIDVVDALKSGRRSFAKICITVVVRSVLSTMTRHMSFLYSPRNTYPVVYRISRIKVLVRFIPEMLKEPFYHWINKKKEPHSAPIPVLPISSILRYFVIPENKCYWSQLL